MQAFEELMPLVIEAAIRAGKETLKYYGKEIEVDYKSDDSPLTKADLASNKVIMSFLDKTDIPVLSEENTNAEYEDRKDWNLLWIVDPLDGTKEFVKNRDEYTINIALVKDNAPVLGVIYVPVKDILYYGALNNGAFKVENAFVDYTNYNELQGRAVTLPNVDNKEKIVVVASQSHRNAETDAFIANVEKQHASVEIQSYGSSLKLCMVAEGVADIYPRIAPTMEWDTAAGQAIVESAGCKVVRYPELDKVKYNKENLLNPWFVVYKSGIESLIK